MENISRKMGKNVAPNIPKLSKKSGGRRILLVGKDGNVRHVGWLKGLFVLCLILMAISAGAAGLFYYLYQLALDEIQLGRDALVESESRVRALTKERNQYMAQMVVAETKLGNHRVPNDGKNVKNGKKNNDTPDEPASVEKQPEKTAVDNGNETAKEPVPETGKAVQPVDNSIKTDNNDNSAASPSPVEAYDLQVKKNRNTIRLEFSLKNISPDERPISGQAVVVLKTKGDSKNWLAMPDVRLVSGKPDGAQRGERFRISRFKSIDLTARTDKDMGQFEAATIFIFDEEGGLILEKDFQITVE